MIFQSGIDFLEANLVLILFSKLPDESYFT